MLRKNHDLPDNYWSQYIGILTYKIPCSSAIAFAVVGALLEIGV